jgi:1-aminocyclopropane-1-carboxylate deaminase/D-cysteine desulfhydrase-like pyridoxal-dependent ACC family enzyme
MKITEGVEPTPLELAKSVSNWLGRRVWVKREDLLHPEYGGSKVRKLVYLLRDALKKDATDLVTFGPIGSHHVLATAVHGIAEGFAVHAVLIPGPQDAETASCYRAALQRGCQTVFAATQNQAGPAMLALLARLRSSGRRPYLILPGGTSPIGGIGMLDAVDELCETLIDAEMPSHSFCAVGSGGTYAGLVAGAHQHRLPMHMMGVAIREGWTVEPWYLMGLALQTARAAKRKLPRRGLYRRFEMIDQPCGRDYGAPCAAAEEAMALFAEDGLLLDPTYSGKAAAALIAHSRKNPDGGDYMLWLTFGPNRL